MIQDEIDDLTAKMQYSQLFMAYHFLLDTSLIPKKIFLKKI